MQPYQQRVVDEKAALDAKLENLIAFTQGETFAEVTATERSLLRQQVRFMRGYSDVLGERIAQF